jgi:mRNA interferase RelE/StbE
MSYQVLLSKTARKTYDKLPQKLQKGVDRAIEYLKVNPLHNPNARSLKGETGSYRYQIGGWRILYEVYEEAREVRIYDIGPRGDVYKH